MIVAGRGHDSLRLFYSFPCFSLLIFEPLRINIDLMTYEIEFKLFIVLDTEVMSTILQLAAF